MLGFLVTICEGCSHQALLEEQDIRRGLEGKLKTVTELCSRKRDELERVLKVGVVLIGDCWGKLRVGEP